MGTIIAVMNNKGGVGKTTVTCNLATSLGKQGHKVLVVDADPQANASTLMLLHKQILEQSLYDVLAMEDNSALQARCIYPTDNRNVEILPNTEYTASLEPELIANGADSFLRLRNTLRGNKNFRDYSYIIIDCPPNMGTFVLCSLYASDFGIVPILAKSSFSVEGLIKAMGLIRNVQNSVNPDLRFLRILINAIDRRTTVSRSIVQQIQRVFNEGEAFKTQIPVSTSFEKAEFYKETLFKRFGTTPGATAYRSLARELTAIVEDGKHA